MYLHQTLTPLEAVQVFRAFAIPCPVKPEVLASARKIEVWSSSFKDAGPDFNEVRIVDSKGNLHKCVIGGY